MAKNDDLELLVFGGPGTQRHELDHPAHREVQKRHEQWGSVRLDDGRLTLDRFVAPSSTAARVYAPHRVPSSSSGPQRPQFRDPVEELVD
jgi:hypothetical protein